MIIVTGAAGFVGSCLVKKLNEENFNDLILVDDFSNDQKNKNLEGKRFTGKVDRKQFFNWLDENHQLTQFIFHIGARTDTTEFNKKIFDELNVEYSKRFGKSVQNMDCRLFMLHRLQLMVEEKQVMMMMKVKSIY